MIELPKRRVILNNPQYDQSEYMGRVRHFFNLTNPLNLLVPSKKLEKAKNIVEKNIETGGVVSKDTKEWELWIQKYIYDSVYNPKTGEKRYFLARTSAEVPMNTLLVTCMLTFYKTNAQTVFFQWLNQTFNAGVNYTNQLGVKNTSNTRFLASYICACGGAIGIALCLRRRVKRSMYRRLVPFAAVAGAQCVNVPMLRSKEILDGASCFTKDDVYVGKSCRAAICGIALVVLSRIMMAAPALVATPLFMQFLKSRGFFCFYPDSKFTLTLCMVAVLTLISTPLCYALVQDKSSLGIDWVENALKEELKKTYPKETKLYYSTHF